MDLLSICIPTYNRRERLKELLEKLCNWNKDNIKIIIIDNASTDGTEKIMESFSKFSNIIYFRNDSNIGHDGNFIRIIEEGKKVSKYSLWLGDDDRVTKDFFYDVPKLLIENKPDVMILNSTYYTNNLVKRLIKRCLNIERSILNLEDDVLESDLKKFFIEYFDKLPFGTIIVNNSEINLDNILKYKGTYHLYGGAIWEMLNDKNKREGFISAYVTAKSYVAWGKGCKSYSNIKSDVHVGIGKFFAILPDALQDVACNLMNKMLKEKVFGNYTKIVGESYMRYKNHLL